MSADRCVKKIAEEIANSYMFLATGQQEGKEPDREVVIMAETKCDNCSFVCSIKGKIVKGKLSSIVKNFSGTCADEES